MSNSPVLQEFLDNYKHYKNIARKIARGNTYLSEEIMQDSYLVLSRRESEVTHIKTWIYITMKNIAYHYTLRRRNQIFKGSVSLEKLANTHFNKDSRTPLHDLERKDLIKEIKKGTKANRKQDIIIRLKLLEDLSLDEIAERTNMPKDLVNSNFQVNKKAGRFNWLKELL